MTAEHTALALAVEANCDLVLKLAHRVYATLPDDEDIPAGAECEGWRIRAEIAIIEIKLLRAVVTHEPVARLRELVDELASAQCAIN